MARQYRYISESVMAERLLSLLEGLEAEHLHISAQLAAIRPAPDESEDSFERRRNGLLERLASIEATLDSLEKESPAPVLRQAAEIAASRNAAIQPIGESSGKAS